MSRDEKYERYLEARAESLGLPTDPAAYKDGGFAVAATAATIAEADLIALNLNAAGIPAWVDAPNTSFWHWDIQYSLSPGGIQIVVPLGRLKDARAVLDDADKKHQRCRSGRPPASDDTG